MSSLLVLVALARAEDGAEPPSEEVTVYSEAVAQAREAVVQQVVALGYDRVRERQDRTVYQNDTAWKGKVVLFDDGRLATRRTAPRGRAMEPIAGTRIRPYFLCVVAPTACFEAGSWYVSEARWQATEDEVATVTAAPLGTLGDRLADEALAAKLERLPDDLDALWTRGVPLEAGGATLVGWEERRAALLSFWDSRTETAWGRAVRDVVGAFVRAVVQASEHPYSAEERARFEAERSSAEPFPWTATPTVD